MPLRPRLPRRRTGGRRPARKRWAQGPRSGGRGSGSGDSTAPASSARAPSAAVAMAPRSGRSRPPDRESSTHRTPKTPVRRAAPPASPSAILGAAWPSQRPNTNSSSCSIPRSRTSAATRSRSTRAGASRRGRLKQERSWGLRKMSYEINQRTEADYRFFRFEKGGSVLDELNHNLKITDGVLRFRIFKVDPRAARGRSAAPDLPRRRPPRRVAGGAGATTATTTARRAAPSPSPRQSRRPKRRPLQPPRPRPTPPPRPPRSPRPSPRPRRPPSPRRPPPRPPPSPPRATATPSQPPE